MNNFKKANAAFARLKKTDYRYSNAYGHRYQWPNYARAHYYSLVCDYMLVCEQDESALNYCELTITELYSKILQEYCL